MTRRSGPDLRGNSRDRAARKRWLVSPEAGFGGNGRDVPCYWCGTKLRKPEADRYPVCGHDGGRYTRDNIVPACRSCNASRCASCVPEGMTDEEAYYYEKEKEQ